MSFNTYSTVTNPLSRDELDSPEYIIKFTVSISGTNLNYYPEYNVHQKFLFEKCIELKKSSLGYRKISNWFNAQNIKTPIGNEFKGNYVFSILKKGRIREERMNIESEWKIEEVKIDFC